MPGGKLEEGQIAELKKKWSEEDLKTFGELTGDFNPIHFDSQYASNTVFKRRIVHGMLTSSLFGSLIAQSIPGSIYLSQTLKFKAPVFLNDQVCASIQVFKIRKEKCIVSFSTKATNQDGTVVIEGEAFAKIPIENL